MYRKLLYNGYMHWREERLLILPLHELPILRRHFSFISYCIWGIISERSLLAVVNEKISLLDRAPIDFGNNRIEPIGNRFSVGKFNRIYRYFGFSKLPFGFGKFSFGFGFLFTEPIYRLYN